MLTVPPILHLSQFWKQIRQNYKKKVKGNRFKSRTRPRTRTRTRTKPKTKLKIKFKINTPTPNHLDF